MIDLFLTQTTRSFSNTMLSTDSEVDVECRKRYRNQRKDIDLYVRNLVRERDGIIDGFLRE